MLTPAHQGGLLEVSFPTRTVNQALGMTQSSLKLKLSPVSTKFGGIFQDVFLACGLKTWAFGIPQAKMQYLLTLVLSCTFLWRPAGQLLAIFIQGSGAPCLRELPVLEVQLGREPGETRHHGELMQSLATWGGGQCCWAPESLGLSGGFSSLPGCYLTWFALSQGSAFLSPAFLDRASHLWRPETSDHQGG